MNNLKDFPVIMEVKTSKVNISLLYEEIITERFRIDKILTSFSSNLNYTVIFLVYIYMYKMP